MQQLYSFGANNHFFNNGSVGHQTSNILIPVRSPSFLPVPPAKVIDKDDTDTLMVEEDNTTYPTNNDTLFTENGPINFDAALASAFSGVYESAEEVIDSLYELDSLTGEKWIRIEESHLRRLLEGIRKKEGFSWLLKMILHVQTRMVHGDVTRRAKRFTLGVAKAEFVKEWFEMMEPTSTKSSSRTRRTRESGGYNEKDSVCNMRFVGESIGTMPVAPKGWNKFYFERIHNDPNKPSEWYHFCLD